MKKFFIFLFLPSICFAQTFVGIDTGLWKTALMLPDSMREQISEINRYDSWVAARMDPNPKKPFATMLNALKNYQAQPQQKNPLCKGSWTQYGINGNAPCIPGCTEMPDNAGRINAIEVLHDTLIYIGTSGGMYVRNDKTNVVTPLKTIDNLFSDGIDIIKIAPSATKNIYAASGTGVSYYGFGQNAGCSTGLYKTANGGATQFQTTGINWGLASGYTITDVTVNPTNASNIWVVAHSYFSPVYPSNPSTHGIVEHSTDGGTTWKQVNFYDNFFWSLRYSPDGKTIYLSGHHLYKSADGGTTWVNCDKQLTGLAIDTTTMSGIIEVATCEQGSPAFFNNYVSCFAMCTGTPPNKTNYWVSSNGFSTAVKAGGGADAIGCWYLRPPVFAMEATGPQTFSLYAGATSFLYANNNTGNIVWRTQYGIAHADVRSLGVPYYHNGSAVIWVGTDGGLYKSTDGGATFTSYNEGLNCGEFYNADIDSTGNIVIGAQDDAIFATTYLNGFYMDHLYFGDGAAPLINKNEPSIFYAQDFQAWGNIYEGGKDQCKETIRTGDSGDYHYSPIPVALESDNERLYMGWHELYYYDVTNGGVYQLTNLKQQYPDAGYITYVESSKMDPATVIIATQGGWSNPNNFNDKTAYTVHNLFISHNRGSTFTDISPEIPGVKGTITSVLATGELGNEIYFTMGNYYDLNNKNENVFYSLAPIQPHDIWVNESSGLPQMPTTKIVADANGNLYCSTDVGVFYTNASKNYVWNCYGSGLPMCRVMDLTIMNNTLYAPTWGRGLWQTPLLNSEPGINSRTGSESFPTQNAKWVYEINVDENGTQATNIETMNTGNDTVINGTSYTAMIGSNCTCPYFYYRVDGEKVFTRTAFSDSDILQLDFGLQLGDTLWHVYGATDPIVGFYCFVGNIDTVLINGTPHKRLFIDNNAEGWRPRTYWIEGVGNLWNMWRWNYETDFEGYTDVLTCFFEDSVLQYHENSPSGKYDCDKLINGIAPVQPSQIVTWVKAGSIYIQNKSVRGGSVTVFDVAGRPRSYSLLPVGAYDIVPGLTAGVYVVQFINDLGARESEKIVLP